LAEFWGIPLGDQPESPAPMSTLLVTPHRRTAALIGEMLQATWSDGLVVAHAQRLPDATHELLARTVTWVLLALPAPDDPIAAVEQIRTAAPDVPIVVLSDDGDEDQALRAVQAGAQDYLVARELSPALLRRSLRYAIERKRLEAQLAHRPLHDPLTGLPNRALFLDRLGVALDRSRRNNASIAVLFLDVDHFKEVNDSLGHAAGDRLLSGLADRLQSMLRPMDTIARFGGDEFTFLFEDLTSEREVVLIAERIGRAVSLPIHLEEGDTTVTVSLGITVVSDPTVAAESVIREADTAMYRAKELGRARYELFDEASRRRAIERIELEGALRHAVERCELRLHFQPTVSLTGTGGVAGLEALLRWEHPERGLLAPGEFVAVAEETGLMLPIGQHVLEQALRQLAVWREHEPNLTISINVSPRQLDDVSLVCTLSGAIRAAGLEPSAVCLDVSEPTISRDLEASTRALHGLKVLGVQIAVDDFGTGSTSLASLKRLPIDAIKVHDSLVAGLGRDPADAAIIRSIVDLGHALGVDVVAEGVETEAQLRELHAIGCDAAQGFLFGCPIASHDVEALLIGSGEQLAHIHTRSRP
jgi:diguanylate cyclase (GGDEF)-like protein